MKGKYAYASVFQQGIEVVDLVQVVNEYVANSTDFAVQIGTDGQGFARGAVVNTIPVKDSSGHNVILQDLKAGDFVLNGGEQATIIVATGSAPGVQPSPVSFVVANPQEVGPAALLYAGVPHAEIGSLTSGTAVSLGTLTDSQPDLNGNLVQRPMAIVVGRGTMLDKSGSTPALVQGPMLAVIDTSDPGHPVLIEPSSWKHLQQM